jgi:acyl-CoA reductase-like NAD-dependent aldehyde dehydrogenase
MTVQESGYDLESKVNTIRASFEAGKFTSLSHRTCQISKIYRILQEKSEVICKAIANDDRCSGANARAEYHLTMDGIRKIHAGLKVPLAENYAAGWAQKYYGKDYSQRRVPLGVVAIRSTSHSRFYSILTVLTAAIAAGNVVVLEVRVYINTRIIH